MNDCMQTRRAWIDLPKGRVRYSGGARGRDEPPIETFAVELDGIVYYGEIKNQYLQNNNDYNLKVVSFGWPNREWPDSLPEPGWCATFTHFQLDIIQKLICQAVEEWRKWDERPFFLYESNKAHFMGEIAFNEGWALINNEGATS